MEDIDLEGEGLFDVLRNIKDRVTGFITGKRDDYPPKVRDLLARYGSLQVTNITVYRDPLQTAVDIAVNALSLGKFNQAKLKGGYDTFFHLYMIVKLDNGVNLRIEKNEVINIEVFNSTPKGQQFNVVSQPVVLNDMLNKTKEGMGEKDFFYYDPITNNCQVFILSIMKFNNLLNSNKGLQDFILQDTQILQDTLNKSTQKGMKLTTDLARRFNILIHGKGFEFNDDLDTTENII